MAWAEGEDYRLNVTIDSRGKSVFFDLGKPKRFELDFRATVQGFADPSYATRKVAVERQTTLGGAFLLSLAEALGPPE